LLKESLKEAFVTRCILIIEVLFLLFIAADCKKNPVVPPPPPPPPPPPADTTSHNFTWATYEFGGSPSYFNDIAIINDSDIWAVGTINEATDSMYNAVHWNGKEWNSFEVPYYYQGQPLYHPVTSVFALSANSVWFAGNGVELWNGSSFSNQDEVNTVWGNYEMEEIWMSPDGNIFIVGDGGSIVHYSNGVWTKMESGTITDLRDVWGSPDGSEVWACGRSNDNSQSVLLKYDGTQWRTVWTRQGGVTAPYGDIVTSLWGEKHLFTATNYGIYIQDITGADTARQVLAVNHFPYRIRGSAENNVAVVGDDGMIWHYNGSTWKLLNEVGSGVPLYSVAVSENMIVAVGADFNVTTSFPPRALIYVGHRSK
jgi:hypothetical protein